MNDLDPITYVLLITLLGFFTGASIAIEANPLIGILIIIFTLIGSLIAVKIIKQKKK